MRLPDNPLQWVAICAIPWLVAGTACASYGKTIHNDLGGLVEKRMAEVERLRESGERVEIRGRCASACVMYMGLPNACTARNAQWGFHGTKDTGNNPAAKLAESLQNMRVIAYYPKAIHRQFADKWSKVKGSQIYWVSGADLIDLGAIRECN